LQFDSEMLEVSDEHFFKHITVDNAWMHLLEETNDLGVFTAKVVGIDKDSLFVEPVKNSDVVDGGILC